MAERGQIKWLKRFRIKSSGASEKDGRGAQGRCTRGSCTLGRPTPGALRMGGVYCEASRPAATVPALIAAGSASAASHSPTGQRSWGHPSLSRCCSSCSTVEVGGRGHNSF